VFDLKNPWFRILPLFLFLLLLSLSPLSAALANPGAEATVLNPNIRVDHEIQVQNGGSIVINDTISLFTNLGENVEPLRNFSMGFPFEYRSNLDYCFAYDASNLERLNVELDAGLERIGFYGIRVSFPASVNVSDGKSYNFTVTFVFSNLIVPSTETAFNITRFPMYPSLTKNASVCAVRVVLPPRATYLNSSHLFNVTLKDDRQILSHTKSSLESFAKEPAWLTFDSQGAFLLIDNGEIRREIALNEMGRVRVSDSYRITNKAGSTLSSIKVGLPKGAYDVSAHDATGGLQVDPEPKGATSYTNATVTFRTTLWTYESVEFTVSYLLPWEGYVNQHGWQDFNLTLVLFERLDWIIRKLSVSITLPDGAEFESYSVSPDIEEDVHVNVQEGAFRETITFTLYNVTLFHDLSFSSTYKHLVFWASLRPTLVVGAIVIALCGVVVLWRAPRPPTPVIPVPTDVLKGFVDAYEERERILLELENMEKQVRKGRIPRRTYKLRRITLEGRLSTLSRNLTDFRESMRKAGPGYANIMRGIEVAETELEGLEEDIRRITALRRSGELSSEAYRIRLEDDHRRWERAKTTLRGYLLRLREEIR